VLLLPSRSLSLVVILLVLITCPLSLWAGDELKPEDIVARHLDAIGSAQARKAVKSRVVQGGATYRVLVGGTGAVDGKFQYASENPKSDMLLKINASGYLGEWFICDGYKTSVAGTWSDKTRSEFGTFVLTQDIILRENLLGGVWSSGWPLLDLDVHKAKVHSEGTKKIDGKDLLVLRYQPKKSTDLDIFLYFDPQTYQHVMTVYKMEPPTTNVGGELAQARKQPRRFKVEEQFSEFRTVDGLDLPGHYDLRFTFEGESGFTKSIEWEVRALSIDNNMSIDSRAFEVK